MSQTLDISKALNLRLNHQLTYEQIGTILNKSKQAVHNQIKHLIPTEQTKDFKVNRANIFSHLQLRLLSQLTEAKIKKMQPRDLVVSAGILYDKERLERGQSTQNIGYDPKSVAATIAECKALLVQNGYDNQGAITVKPESVKITDG